MEPQVTRKACFRRLPGCSAAALAIALAAVPAHGQSFNASGSVISGLANITTGAGTTTIDVDAAEVVIDWSLDGTIGSGPINFQNQNTTATFQTQISSNFPNYTVLNRVLPISLVGAPVARPVQFNGTVESFSQGSPGGNIWFYSPTGIIAGPTATFNVGSLLLTTNDIDTAGGLYGPGNTVRFRGTAGSTGFVTVNPGAQLSTTAGSGDYIAIVASRITQSGTLTSLGQTALVAAEQADITINAGLLDIVVTQGTTDANGIVHDGTTTGPASTGPADPQIIQMVAMPKNTALTMLLSGNIGYAPAAAAVIDGSAIVLQSGVAPYVTPATQALGLGNISIGNTVFTNAVQGDASNTIAIQPVSGLVDFQRDASLAAGRTITATAETGEEIRGGRGLFLSATLAGTGGTATMRALGSGATSGLIDVAGSLVLDASGFAFVPPVPEDDGADGLGGTAQMIADGGRIRGGTIDILAIGSGAVGNLNGGDGRGNLAELTISNNGSINANTVFIGADGQGGGGFLTGGNGFGGTATATFNGGPLTTDVLTVAADAFGGQADRQTGSATGGKATAQVTSGAQTWGLLNVTASAFGGQTFAAGSFAGSAAGQADGARLIVSGPATSLRLFNESAVRADAIASINDAAGAPAASAIAGGANATISGGAQLTVGTRLTVSADASVDSESYIPNPDTTPSVTGGDARLTVDNGRVTASALIVSSQATGAGALTSGGAARGGDALAEAANGGRITLNLDDGGGLGTLLVVADAHGGNGPSPSQAQGGTARLTASDAAVTAQASAIVSANGTDGDFTAQTLGTGYNAAGGTASLEALAGAAGTAAFAVRDLVVRADGISNGGSLPVSGNGGNGTGGNATLTAAAGTITALSATVQTHGGGSDSAAIISGAPYRSGDGLGGTARADITGGNVTVTGAFNVVSQGFGAGGGAATAGALPALSGNGTGLSSTLNVAAGSINAATILVDATGFGGPGMANFSSGPGNGGDGGNGQGGTARFITPAGGTGSAGTSGTMRVIAEGIGGAGGTASTSSGSNGFAGSGSGGSAVMDLRSGDFAFGPVSLSANGKAGGLVTLAPSNAGNASFSLIDPALGATRNRKFSSLTLSADTVSGNSGSNSVTMQVGDAGSALGVLGNFTATAIGSTSPALAGNGFSAQISGAPLVIGADALIATDRDIAMTVGTGGKFDGQAGLNLSTPRTITTTGLIGSGGNSQVQGGLGIAMTDLLSGGTTLLTAPGGTVTVSSDLESVGPVTVLGRGVDLTSLGALTFADADATAGNLRIRTAGNLNTATVDASGTVTLGSTGGAFTATAPITAGSNVAIDATGGITAPTVNSGGTTLLRATGGAISVTTNLNAPGLVTVFGRSADLVSIGPLSFDDADATAGPLAVKANGNLVFNTIDASGALTLLTTTGSLTTNGAVNSGVTQLDAPSFIRVQNGLAASGGLTANTAGLFLSNGLVSTGGATAITAPSGINIDRLSSGGTTLLRAVNGTVGVSGNLRSLGLVTVLGRVVNLLSDGPLAFADADATAGNLSIQTAGDLAMATVDASGAVLLTSTGGAFTASGNVTAGGTVSIDAAGGISAPTATSGGTTLLRATGGAVVISTNLASPGAVTVLGRSVNIVSTGGLAFADADASAGDLAIRTAGNLDVTTVDANGAIALTSTGGSVRNTGTLTGNGLTMTAANNVIADGAIATAGALTVTAGATFAGPANIVAGGAVSIDAVNGISAQSVSSGGSTLLRATGGAVAVSGNLTSPGAVTALGRSVSITSSSGLTFADADATAGDLTVSAGGPLSFATADATGALSLSTSAGNLRATGAIAGSSIALTSASGIQLDANATSGGTFQASTGGAFASTGTVASTGNASIVATQGIGMATLNSGGTTLLRATGGPVNIANLLSSGAVTVQGQSVSVASTSGLILADADATAGNLGIQAAGDLNVATVDATGAVTLASTGGSLRNTGAVNGASIALNAATSVTADANLAASGALQVNAGGNFQVNGRAVGSTIAARSADIGIGSEAQLGVRGSTQTIVLTNRTPTNRTLIGGANPSGGYSISSAEAARLFADQRITITTPNDTSAPADFVIGDLALSYGGTAGNLGAGGTLKVDAFGRVAVNGMVRLTTSSASDTFSIDPTRIEVIADQGGIVMRNASGALTGQLELAADTVLVGTAANIAAVDAVDPLPQVNALLDAPSTVPSDGGYLQAGHISVRVSSGFFGQNSGLSTGYPARRGFTANSMAISTTAPDTQISINGQIVNDAGLAVTGLQAVPLIDINGAPATAGGLFDPQSTINGCMIGSSCGSSSSTVVPKSTIDDLLGTPAPGSSAFRTVSIEVDEKEEDKQLPLVDEPVTGVGNDDLWPRVCDTDSTECDKEGNGQ